MVKTKEETIVSPAGSFKGHDWAIWWDKNKGIIKNFLVFAMFAYIIIKMAFGGIEYSLEAIIGGATSGAILFKVALDKLDFFATTVKD